MTEGQDLDPPTSGWQSSHKATSPKYKIVCGACGKIYGKHSFDESCMLWCNLVFAHSVTTKPDGRVSSCDAVPNAPHGFLLYQQALDEGKESKPT